MNDIISGFGSTLLTILAFIAVIVPLVLVHEFGHYWVAIRCGVHVETFSIGFGKALLKWRDKRGTEWRFAPILLGGYVKMYGDSDPSSFKQNAGATELTAEQRSKAFFTKSISQRAAIVAAGPLINFLFAIILLYGLFVAIGQPFTPAKISKLTPGMPAETVGMQVGDSITAMNDKPVQSLEQIRKFMLLNLAKPVDVTVDRNGQPLVFKITPKVLSEGEEGGPRTSMGKLGIESEGRIYKPHSLLSAAGASLKSTWEIASGNVIGVWQIITGERDRKELSSVISIAKISRTAVETVASTIGFIATLSVVLGVFNLFPIPVLDGGHLLFYGIEAIRRKPLSENAQEYSLRFGMGLILTVMAFALWNDVRNNGWIDKLTQLLT